MEPEACGQTLLPDRSILGRQKLVENEPEFFSDFSNDKWCQVNPIGSIILRVNSESFSHLVLYQKVTKKPLLNVRKLQLSILEMGLRSQSQCARPRRIGIENQNKNVKNSQI